MKQTITQLIEKAIEKLQKDQLLPETLKFQVNLERTRQKSHGDFACNIAMILCKQAGMPPRDLAQKLLESFELPDEVEKAEIAGPGFINFTLKQAALGQIVHTILEKRDNFGKSTVGQNQRVNVEFVSANPTGPLHVGHGRGAAFGSGLADLLEYAGYAVHREYYVNDAGRQMDILATSVFLRYLELNGQNLTFPSNGYQGGYIKDIAELLCEEHQDKFVFTTEQVFADVPADQPEGDKEQHIDGLIANAKELLGSDYSAFHQKTLNEILDGIKDDLREFQVLFQEWFSEKGLVTSGDIQKALDQLQNDGHTYEKDGAIWFKSESFGDDKDRVLVRDNGQTTYFASDAAYLLNKFNRGFDTAIYVLGADHHGYIARLKGLAKAFGINPDRIHIPLVQFANLFRGKEPVSMSTRSGEFVTLKDLYDEVGVDAARFFYLMRKNEQHLDFDLELAKSQSNDNPVYYVQYAHARICSVFNQLRDKGFEYEQAQGLEQLERLTSEQEQSLLTKLAKFPEVIENAARTYEPHQITYYLRDIATEFHSYYNSCHFIVDDAHERNAKLVLVSAIKQVLMNGLKLLGISAPESM